MAASQPGRPPRIGVLGGTFDPVHIAHLVSAVNVRAALGLDRVLLVVANEPWQKVGTRPISPAADRLAMVEAAVAGVDGVEASAIEIERGGPSYTADTIAALRAAFGDAAELFLVVGADVAGELETWVRVDEVRAACTLVVVDRVGRAADVDSLAEDGWAVERVAIPALAISSTDLRLRVAEGRPLDFLVPAAAIRCIRERALYARDE